MGAGREEEKEEEKEKPCKYLKKIKKYFYSLVFQIWGVQLAQLFMEAERCRDLEPEHFA